MTTSSEARTKDPVSLEDLKRALDAVPAMESGVKAYVYQSRRADAWRTAFEWRDNVSWNASPGLYWEGMRLIREKLS